MPSVVKAMIWPLVACDLGADCGRDSPFMRGLCLQRGLCGYPDAASALRAYTEAVELWRRAGIKPAQWTLRAMHGRVRVLEQTGRAAEALAMAEELLPLTDGNVEYKGQAGKDLEALIARLRD